MTTAKLRELDVFCAVEVMGWKRYMNYSGSGESWHDSDGIEQGTFDPTTSHADALAVLEKCAEKLRKQDFIPSINICMFKDGVWWVTCLNKTAKAETLPLAIALFAKKLFEK